MKNKKLFWALFIFAATGFCICLAYWNTYCNSEYITDKNSPVSFQEYRVATQNMCRHLGADQFRYQQVYEMFRYIPFYCTEEMMSKELKAIHVWAETGISPISWEKLNQAVSEAYAKYNREGGVYPPEKEDEFFCTPVMMENIVRFC